MEEGDEEEAAAGMKGLGLQGLGFRARGLGFRAWGQGLGFRV